MFVKTNDMLKRIKAEKPLILNLTNFVTMDFIANGLLSLGASPIMSQAEQEMEDLLQLANTVVINLGTLNESFISLCRKTCKIANQLQKPIVLDPVGVGASHYRTKISTSFINEFQFAFIRGNASEISALAGAMSASKGVDSMIESQDAIQHAQSLAQQYRTTVVMSGSTDIVIDANRMAKWQCGSPLMPLITGSGCLLTAVIAAFHAIENETWEAANAATLFYGICGEVAARKAAGPGSFRTQFLDALSLFPERVRYEKI